MKLDVITFLFFLILYIIFPFKGVTQENSTDPFEIYTQDKDNKILIVPFESKMYASSIDKEIAIANNMQYIEVKEAIKKSVSEQILLSLSQKTPAVSLAHHQDSANKMLNYIYNSIGFKYDLVKTKDTVQTQPSKKELIKDKLNKFVNQIQAEIPSEKKEYDRGTIHQGEVLTSNHYADRFMNVVINNPNLLSDLQLNYQTNYFIFVNEFHIGRSYRKKDNYYKSYRKLNVHYTVLNKKGKEVDAGVAETEMPADIHNLNKIEKIYLSQLAEDLCAFVPDPVLEKNTVKKEAEDSKKAKSQRKVIQGLISE